MMNRGVTSGQKGFYESWFKEDIPKLGKAEDSEVSNEWSNGDFTPQPNIEIRSES